MSELSSRTPQQEIPTKEQIAHRAYELYEQRGRQDGRDMEDWLVAERELRGRNSSVAVASSSNGETSTTFVGSRQKQLKSRAAAAFNSKVIDSHASSSKF